MSRSLKQLLGSMALSPLVIYQNVFAATTTAGVPQVESFLKGIITAVAGLAGVVASGFFVAGGFRYITSSGKPQNLESAKRTILYSATGLAITIAAFVLTNIVSSLATSAFGG
jgi:hypothetical protein